MKYAVLRGTGLLGNIIFDSNSPANRDNIFAPYVLLKEKLLAAGVQIDTADKSNAKHLAFQLDQDVQANHGVLGSYLLLLETELVKPGNGDPVQWSKYKRIFTWNDDLVDGDRFIKINFPNSIQVQAVDGFEHRDQFCCLIASNKTLAVHDERNLYPERVKAIRWFERHAPEDFVLYGLDWNMPVIHSGLLGKVKRRMLTLFRPLVKLNPFPSYKGLAAHKRDVLTHTRFSICYENVRDLPGYITEKIFDCFFSGCVPVYWGACNISDYVPADCFIDRRNFNTTEEVHIFLKGMSEAKFMEYQQHIVDFLRSKAAYPFSSEYFAETIVTAIAQDIGSQV